MPTQEQPNASFDYPDYLAYREALGAGWLNILGFVLGRGFKIVGFGIVIGVVMALALTSFFRSLLYGIGTYDPIDAIFLYLTFALLHSRSAQRPTGVNLRKDGCASVAATVHET